jgi:hypothetical protein
MVFYEWDYCGRTITPYIYHTRKLEDGSYLRTSIVLGVLTLVLIVTLTHRLHVVSAYIVGAVACTVVSIVVRLIFFRNEFDFHWST